jgi:hypothetical protein
VLWPQRNFDKPVIVEYWGLLREDVAQWVLNKRERYVARKEYKENIYSGSDYYYYVGILPNQIHMIEELLQEVLS